MYKKDLYLGDCFDLISSLPNESIDSLITDPPYYYLYKESWDQQWKNIDEYALWLDVFFEAISPKLKPNANIVCFSSSGLNDIVAKIIRNRFYMRGNIVWVKQDAAGAEKGVAAKTTRSPVAMSERITLASKTANPLGDRIRQLLKASKRRQTDLVKYCTGKVTGLVGLWLTDRYKHGACEPTPSMWEKVCSFFDVEFDYDNWAIFYDPEYLPYDVIKIDYVKNKSHSCEKPLELMNRIILATTREDGVVLDPFMGSGTTGVAAIQNNRNFIGIEKNPEYFAEAQKRIENISQRNAS